jgi:predicted nucleic acid-binding protein
MDPTTSEKRATAAAWIAEIWANSLGRISYQVLIEFQSASTKVAPTASVAEIREFVRDYAAWNPVTTDHQLLEGAWRLQDRYGISWWDALIVAAAEVAGCEYLLTEDMQDGQRLGGVTVVDPFVHEVGEVLV